MKTFCIVAVLLFALGSAHGQVTFKVTNIPDKTPAGAVLYIAGSFQGWSPASPTHAFNKNTHGTYELTLDPGTGSHEYKVTRGSWERVETTAEGGFLQNRTFSYDGTPVTIELTIAGWDDLIESAQNPPSAPEPVRTSTASENVRILNDSFYMPQLDRHRRVWVYLPPDYETSDLSYPVLYMHDGQNVFDASMSYSGEWRVDETLDSLHATGVHACIVVAVDNGQVRRLDEYSPWKHPGYGGGEGDEYIAFVVNTLKPYIDSTFRTRPDRDHTGIMGSSMGGLISLYAGIAHPEVFGLVGSFSPAYWFSEESHEQVRETPVTQPLKIYTIAGELEGTRYTDEIRRMQQDLLEAGHNPDYLSLIIHEDGNHREWYWAREFSEAYLWLFSGE